MAQKIYPGASVCIVKNDQIVFQQSYGTYTPATPVYVASAGKWIAAATIAVVVDKTKLDWENPVDRWLPEFRGNPQGKIKLRQLLSHTSGIRDYLPDPEIDTFSVLKKSVERIVQLSPSFSLGSRFQYGGLAMQVAGRMAEVAYKKEFETIFEEEIARPLGMKNSHFIPINLEEGHAPMLGGGLQTTLNDYIHFLSMIYHDGIYEGKQILKKETVAEMQADQVREASVVSGEYIEKAFGSFHTGIYGLGEWREKLDSNGVAYQISSPGWAGAYPWINKKDSVYGFFIAHVQSSRLDKDFSPFYDAPIISNLTSAIVHNSDRKQGFADMGDAQLFYEEKGVGTPVILLHAHSVDRRMWDAQFDALAKHFRVIRYDLRGYGLSSMPAEGKEFTACEDLKRVMDFLQIPKAHLVGLSLGAMIISDFITKYPDRVQSAVLADGALSYDLQPKEPEQDLKTFKANWKASMREGSCADSPFLISLIDDWRMWQVSHRESPKLFLGTSARNYYETNKVKTPVLFFVGACDFEGTKKAVAELSALIPGSKISTIKNAGHFSCIEKPEEFTEKLLRFITESLCNF
ncbi:MAG: class A beta-lactamase-related serine hydrolase [Bacteroidales bacterium]|nr:class A beta-lactamase-related serine hydrolase [Bacteroidales bacterium]